MIVNDDNDNDVDDDDIGDDNDKDETVVFFFSSRGVSLLATATVGEG